MREHHRVPLYWYAQGSRRYYLTANAVRRPVAMLALPAGMACDEHNLLKARIASDWRKCGVARQKVGSTDRDSLGVGSSP